MIRKALPSELPVLAAIEDAAAEKFRGTAMEFVLSLPKAPIRTMAVPDTVTIWAACDDADQPIAFLEAEAVQGWLHILELSVHPFHQRKGHARALIDTARAFARSQGLEAVSLTTDRELPWNGPAYARMGFRELTAPESPDWLLAILTHEITVGFDPLRRVAMIRTP